MGPSMPFESRLQICYFFDVCQFVGREGNSAVCSTQSFRHEFINCNRTISLHCNCRSKLNGNRMNCEGQKWVNNNLNTAWVLNHWKGLHDHIATGPSPKSSKYASAWIFSQQLPVTRFTTVTNDRKIYQTHLRPVVGDKCCQLWKVVLFHVDIE